MYELGDFCDADVARPLAKLHLPPLYYYSSRTFHPPCQVNLWANGAIHILPPPLVPT